MAVTIGQWLSMTTENPKEDEKRWYGLELSESDHRVIIPRIKNEIGGATLMSSHEMKKDRIHTDIYLTPQEFSVMNEIIDKYLAKQTC